MAVWRVTELYDSGDIDAHIAYDSSAPGCWIVIRGDGRREIRTVGGWAVEKPSPVLTSV